MPRSLSRRNFLKITGAGSLGLILHACGSGPSPTILPTNTLLPTRIPPTEPLPPLVSTPTQAVPRQRGSLSKALMYYVGYATEENMRWVEQFDVDVLVRGFLLFLNTNDSWISHYTSQMEQCQNEGRLFLAAIQAAVLVEDGKDLPQIEQNDPAFSVPMDSIPEWEQYACQTPTGSTLKDQGLPFAHACINNASFQEFFREKLQKIIDTGADGVHIDELPTRYFTMHEGYCDACMQGFKDFLTQKFPLPELNAKYGIENVQTFDFRNYLAAEGLLEKPPQSPLHGEWWLFQLSNLAKVENELFSACKSYAQSKNRDFIVNGNAFEPEHEPKHVIEMTLTDFASIGTNMSINLNLQGQLVSNLRVPPNYSYIPVYRLAQGVMPGKPISIFIDGPGGANLMRGLPEQKQKDVVRWMFAEANAAEGHFNIPYPSVGYYGPLSECQQYAGFIRDTSSMISGAEHLAEVGVIFSYASQIWDYWEESDATQPNHHREWYGLCQGLTDLSVQYDVIFAPDGQIIPESLTLEQLLKYEKIIVPWAYALNDQQVGLMADYAQKAGSLIILGAFANFDEGKNQRQVSIAENFKHFGATVLPDIDCETYLNDPRGGEASSIADDLKKLFPEQWLSVSDASVTSQLYQAGDALLCHMVNKELQEAGFQTRRDFTVQVLLPSDFCGVDLQALYLSPEMPDGVPTQVSVTHQGTLAEMTIPALEIYGILKIRGAS